MSHRSLRGQVFLGVGICASLGIVYYEYMQQGYLAVLGVVLFYLVLACLDYSNWQGRKLADANMRQHGLDPDRDEAQPACKAIDN